MFIFKFISPFVSNFHNIKANHGIALFILSKKAYLEIKTFYKDIKDRKNIFNFQKYFPDFLNNGIYSSLAKQVKNDLEIIEVQTTCYSADI